MQFLLLINRQGKVRLSSFYINLSNDEKRKIIKDVSRIVLNRPSHYCNIVEWRDGLVVYKRYATLFFIAGISSDENEILALDIIHHFVEVLDKYFSNVCELDLIFNFHKAYFILNEIILGGELLETNKQNIIRICSTQDAMMESELDISKKSTNTPY